MYMIDHAAAVARCPLSFYRGHPPPLPPFDFILAKVLNVLPSMSPSIDTWHFTVVLVLTHMHDTVTKMPLIVYYM